jgi:hypothetical protein
MEINRLCPEETPQFLEEACGTRVKRFLNSANGLLYVLSSPHNARQLPVISDLMFRRGLAPMGLAISRAALITCCKSITSVQCSALMDDTLVRQKVWESGIFFSFVQPS